MKLTEKERTLIIDTTTQEINDCLEDLFYNSKLIIEDTLDDDASSIEQDIEDEYDACCYLQYRAKVRLAAIHRDYDDEDLIHYYTMLLND